MRCIDVEPLLSDYADGIADERGRRIVERHIQLCGGCKDSVLLARQLGQQLARLSLLPIGVADRTPRLRRRLEQKMARRYRLGLALFASRATLALLLSLVSILFWLIMLNVVV